MLAFKKCQVREGLRCFNKEPAGIYSYTLSDIQFIPPRKQIPAPTGFDPVNFFLKNQKVVINNK
jgi:hypothetical protein